MDRTYAGVPDFRVVPRTITASGSRVAAEWLMSGTHSGDLPGLPATHEPFEVRAVSIATLEASEIRTIVDDWNPIQFRRSVGLM